MSDFDLDEFIRLGKESRQRVREFVQNLNAKVENSRHKFQVWRDFMAHSETCPVCKGTGKLPGDVPCHGCGGKGWVTVQDGCGENAGVSSPKPGYQPINE